MKSASKTEQMHVALLKMRKSDLKDFQNQITDWAKEYKIPELAKLATNDNPEKSEDIKRRIIAFMGEGKTLENSCL